MSTTSRSPRTSRTRKSAPATKSRKSATHAGASRSKAPRARTRAKKAANFAVHIDPARVVFTLLLLAVTFFCGLLLDVYLGQSDPVHKAMVNGFGPLAFLVPVGASLLVLDFYRRHEGYRPWLHFEGSCGAVLLFVSTLTMSSLVGLSYSLVGNSLSDELAGLLSRPGALLVVLCLLAVGILLTFHVTPAQIRLTYQVIAGKTSVMGERIGETWKRWSARHQTSPAGIMPPMPGTLLQETPGMPARAPVSIKEAREKAAVKMRLSPEDAPIPPDFSALSEEEEPEEQPAPETLTPVWPAPAINLLDAVPPAVAAPANNEARARTIEATLSSFNVSAEVVDVQAGPTVTQFGLRPAAGVRVQRITALSNDLALALAAPSIRIEAPVPGKPIVGIEIPNGNTALVTLREILESDAYTRARSPLKIALGKNVSGEPVVVDLAKMPHLLIAGATGSGKSVCLNSLIACLLFHNSPERLRLLMIDPKLVELTTFNGVPHLLRDVVTEMDKVSGTLKWALKEMHRRYKLLGEEGARNIARYNELQYEKRQQGEPASERNKPLPYIVCIIDELADLMMVSPAEVEDNISRLAALARATGIHLVLATQRPSVDVITGVIKANFPARIAFAVSSQVDSRTILDQAGAEKLMGRGDMLYLASDGTKAMRVQGTYLSDQEIERIVQFWKNNAPYEPEQIPDAELETLTSEQEGENEDKLLSEAMKVVREYQRASVSLLQRRLSIGYSRAARLLDQLEERGVVGPSEDGRSRVVVDMGDEVALAIPGSEEEPL